MKTIGLLLVSLVAAGTAWAATPGAGSGNHNMAGCGLGYVLFRDNTKGTQILAATTNDALSSNQTFGISSESIGCTQDGLVKADRRREVYAAVNLQKLETEMARGRGEYLDAFAALNGCREPAARRRFARFSQKNFERLFPDAKADAADFLKNVDAELAKDASLSKACSS